MTTRGVAVTVLALCGVMCGACAAPAKSTRLTHGDLNALVAQMIESLAGSAFLGDRNSQSEAIIISINRVENLTHDLIPLREQWMVMARIRGALPLQSFAQERNITFQLEPERSALLPPEDLALETDKLQTPTHVMKAVFRSVRRDVRDPAQGNLVLRREDVYDLRLAITELQTRQIVWSDSFLFKREAVGLLVD